MQLWSVLLNELTGGNVRVGNNQNSRNPLSNEWFKELMLRTSALGRRKLNLDISLNRFELNFDMYSFVSMGMDMARLFAVEHSKKLDKIKKKNPFTINIQDSNEFLGI